MAKPPSELPSGVRVTDIFTVLNFAVIFPVKEIARILEECGCGTKRERNLPSEYVVFFVMMLSLFRNCNHREVYRCVAEAIYMLRNIKKAKIVIPTASALSQARSKLGDIPFQKLFHSCVKPVATLEDRSSYFKRWRVVAIDGSTLHVEDTPKNRTEFGSPTNQHGAASNPQLRFVSLLETGTRLFFATAIGGYRSGESTLAHSLVGFLKPDMLCLADRNFYSFELFKAVDETGGALVWRLQKGLTLIPERRLQDGSYLTTIFSSKDLEKINPLPARIVQYKVTGGSTEKIFLITNILDPNQASAQELGNLYHHRWEHEIALNELKTHLNAKAFALRSKTPKLARQELWGILMTHYVIRKTMYDAAVESGLDPDRLCFTHSVRVIQRALVKATSDFSPSENMETENS